MIDQKICYYVLKVHQKLGLYTCQESLSPSLRLPDAAVCMHAHKNYVNKFFLHVVIYICVGTKYEVYFLNFCTEIDKLILTLLVHWNVGKYSPRHNYFQIKNIFIFIIFYCSIYFTFSFPSDKLKRENREKAYGGWYLVVERWARCSNTKIGIN